MMQVFVKGGGRKGMLLLLWYVHTHTCKITHIQQLLLGLLKALRSVLMKPARVPTHTHTHSTTPPLLEAL